MYDYLIIGSGLAGLSCALASANRGSVLLVSKRNLQESNTWYAQGGIAVVWSKTDQFQKHSEDTFRAGHYHNKKKAVDFIVRHGPEALQKLIKLGVPFSKTDQGSFELSLEGGHQEKRILHSKDSTGKAIEQTLLFHIRQNKNIVIKEKVFAKDLCVKNTVCYGAEFIENKKIVQYFAKRTIIATGGLGQAYALTTNPKIATGDGIAMAFRAGCTIKDIEFIQFHPTALQTKQSPLFLLTEALRGEGATLINSKGERFMLKVHTLAELAPRDIVTKAIVEEQKSGSVFLDLRGLNQQILRQKYTHIYHTLLKENFDSANEPIPITPAAHYSCGGIKTDLHGKTNIDNLFAIGEVACTGFHGANRLASNSLLEAAVMGEQVLQSKLHAFPDKIPAFQVSHYHQQPSSRKLRTFLQKLMWQQAGIVRNQHDLQQALEVLQTMPIPPATDVQSCELLNLHTVAKLIIKAALRRKKSLGTHYILS